MPKLYEYFGITLFFYSNEHEPIHVHAIKGEYESKVEFIIEDAKITDIIISNVKGKKPIKGKDLNDLKKIVATFSNQIISKWIEYFIYHKNIETEVITRKIKWI